MDYSWEEWERIIHEELDNGRPVLYGSETETRVDAFYGKAHAFICDGYDTYGRYHINWGWGGMYNGFYVLSSLDPKNDQTWGGYNRGHEMVININQTRIARITPHYMYMNQHREMDLKYARMGNVRISLCFPS